MKYLALDLSISSTGYCVIDEKENILSYGKIQTQKKDFETEDKRICYICNEIEKIMIENNINIGVFEDQYAGRNVKTFMLLRKCLGAVMKTFDNNNISCKYLSPSEVRKTVCNVGNAKKERIANYIRKHYLDLGEFNDKPSKSKNSDIYDAVALGLAIVKINKEG